jgi:hypothetical protein
MCMKQTRKELDPTRAEKPNRPLQKKWGLTTYVLQWIKCFNRTPIYVIILNHIGRVKSWKEKLWTTFA